jgi:bifunctional enzyme CysN/CysC
MDDTASAGPVEHGHTRELLRIATAGSVDDGKSTLIGRLLFDTKTVPDDQLLAVEEASRRRGVAEVDLALLTDGLRAEREQGITIDVAYRYVSTPRRSFIIADTPGHVQYTRNMVTGASTADLALVLVDARHGIVEQTRRHAALASLLRVPHLVLCINKMDLVGYDRAVFDDIRETFAEFAARLRIGDLQFVPVSALAGDNVVSRSVMMPWYEGPSLLHHLEEVHIASDRDLISTRFPVQLTVRHGGDYRGSAGTVAGGVFRPGDEVLVLPSGQATTIAAIDTADGEVSEAFPPMAVTLRFTEQVDVSRGDLVCRPGNRPQVGERVEAMLCWFDDEAALDPSATYALKHTTRWTRATVEAVRYRL